MDQLVVKGINYYNVRMPLFENPSYFAVLNPYFFLLLHSIHSLDSSPPVFTYDLFFKTDTIGIMKTTVLIFIKKSVLNFCELKTDVRHLSV